MLLGLNKKTNEMTIKINLMTLALATRKKTWLEQFKTGLWKN